jgi:hypothetical protein
LASELVLAALQVDFFGWVGLQRLAFEGSSVQVAELVRVDNQVVNVRGVAQVEELRDS